MFETLPASYAPRAPWSRVAAAALLLHMLGIAAAVSGTAAPLANPRLVARDTIQLLVRAPANPEPSKPGTSPIPPPPVMPPPPLVPYLLLNVPELSLPALRVNPRDLASLGPALPARDTAKPGGAPAAHRLFNATEVDELPELETNLRPRYPEGLRRAGVQGWVQVEYVVGDHGRVNRRTLRALASSHPAFLLSAVAALHEARFRPAQRGGHPVAVLVRQTIRFRIE